MDACECKEFATTLAKTDNLIHSLLEDDKELSDVVFLSKLQELRREHKKSLKIIEDLYKEKLVEKEQGFGQYRSTSTMDLDAELVTFLSGEVRKAYAEAMKRSKFVTFEDPTGATNAVDSDLESIGGSFISDSYFPQDWDRLTIEDVLQSARSILLDAEDQFNIEGDQNDFDDNEQPGETKLGDNWNNKITVPEPFSMTIRDDSKPNDATYSKKFLDKLLESKQLELAAQASYPKFKAKPVPPTTYLPLYDELIKKTEERRQFLREYCKEVLQEKLKPFNLTKSKGIFAHARRCTSMDNLNRGDNGNAFKARPVPDDIISQAVDLAIEQNRLEKLENRKIRAEEMLKVAQLPPNMQMTQKAEYRKALQEKRHKHKCFDRWSFSPHIHRTVPDFQTLQQEFQRNLNEAKIKRSKTTIPEPFMLQTAYVKPHVHNHETHKQAIKRHHSAIRQRSKSWASSLDEKYKQETRKNTAAILRTAAIKRQLNALDEDNREAFKKFQIKMEVEDELKERLREKLIDEDIVREMQDKKRRDLRSEALKSDKQRRIQQIRSITDKLAERPSLLDRQKMLIAKQSAEGRYNKALKSAGISNRKFSVSDKIEKPVEDEMTTFDKEGSPKYSGDEEEEESSTSGSSIGSKSSAKKSVDSLASSKQSRKSSSSKRSSSLSNISHRTKTISSKIDVTVQREVNQVVADDNSDQIAAENYSKSVEKADENVATNSNPSEQPNVQDIFDD